MKNQAPAAKVETDLRVLKRQDWDGQYHINTKPVQEHRDKRGTICNHCSIHDSCFIKGSLNDALKSFPSRVDVVIDKSNEYVPPITFRDPVGLDDAFNTFRLGKAWGDRVVVGSVMGLANIEGAVFGYAKVTDVKVLTKKSACRNHAYANHAFLNRGISKAKAGREMEDLLPKLYGPLFVRNNTHITVIYMKRL